MSYTDTPSVTLDPTTVRDAAERAAAERQAIRTALTMALAGLIVIIGAALAAVSPRIGVVIGADGETVSPPVSMEQGATPL